MYDIYYAHHQWKYNTPEETYELKLIRRYFPNAKIFNRWRRSYHGGMSRDRQKL